MRPALLCIMRVLRPTRRLQLTEYLSSSAVAESSTAPTPRSLEPDRSFGYSVDLHPPIQITARPTVSEGHARLPNSRRKRATRQGRSYLRHIKRKHTATMAQADGGVSGVHRRYPVRSCGR